MSDVRRSFMLSLADSYLAIVLQVLSTMVISRILTPKEVGIFAIAAVISSLANMFRDFGFAEYLIQAKNLDRDRIRAALGLNIAMSWSMALLLLLAAPWAASFYKEPGVGDVLRVLSLSFVIVPFGAVVQSWFRRELNYRPIAITNALSSITSFVVAIWLALAGFSYLSLAWSSFAGIVVTVLGSLWFRPRGFPQLPGLKGVAEVFHFGKYASGVYILSQVGRGAPELIIGRVSGAADVGMFSRANSLVELLRRLLERPVMQVCLPYFAKKGREGASLWEAYASSVGLITGAAWPALASLAVFAYPVIRLVYGEQWTAAVPLAQILCLMCAIDMVTMLSREALLACGEARRASVLQLEVTTAQVVGLMLVIPYGLPGAAWGMVAAALVSAAFAYRHLRVTIDLKAMAILRACNKSALLTLTTAGPLWAVSQFVPQNEGNFVAWGLAGGAAALVLWLAGLRTLAHPLWAEIAEVVGRLRTRGGEPRT
jgi:O-antigen/teichoic acid export membrane protein